MQNYLVYFNTDEENNKKAIIKHIITFGDHYQLGENIFLIKTDLTSVDMFNSFNNKEYINGLFICEINPENAYGLEPKNVWKFLGLFDENEIIEK